jgi:hypothetical protein
MAVWPAYPVLAKGGYGEAPAGPASGRIGNAERQPVLAGARAAAGGGRRRRTLLKACGLE